MDITKRDKQLMLQIQNVFHWFGDNKVLQDVSIDIAAGQIAAIVGPSGCGKSTLLRAILGTHPPRRGEILADGVPIRRPCRDIGIVYQDYSLYDFMTARENVAFGLMLDQTTLPGRLLGTCVNLVQRTLFGKPSAWGALRTQHLESADELLEKVNLGQAANRYPSEMSGGMRQRVAIAQALIMRPKVLLLDEPFGALDEATREELQLMLLRLYEENVAARAEDQQPPYTILIVTHELNEAFYVSDRILGLSQYHAAGSAGATIVYDQPAPVYRPDDARDFAAFEQQKEDLRRAVFDPEHNQHHSDYVTYWKTHSKVAQPPS